MPVAGGMPSRTAFPINVARNALFRDIIQDPRRASVDVAENRAFSRTAFFWLITNTISGVVTAPLCCPPPWCACVRADCADGRYAVHMSNDQRCRAVVFFPTESQTHSAWYLNTCFWINRVLIKATGCSHSRPTFRPITRGAISSPGTLAIFPLHLCTETRLSVISSSPPRKRRKCERVRVWYDRSFDQWVSPSLITSADWSREKVMWLMRTVKPLHCSGRYVDAMKCCEVKDMKWYIKQKIIKK